MKVIVPMAGSGARFKAAGYQAPKPLIPVEDVRGARPMIHHVVDMFQDPADEFVFVCATTQMKGCLSTLRSLRPKSKVVGIAPHDNGPVWTVMCACPYLYDEEEVIVLYCDGTMPWDRQAFTDRVSDLDGCLFTHTGFHPHTLSTTKMAFLKEQGGLVSAVKEKSSYTDDPMSEHASSGVYYFKKGVYVKKYFDLLLKKGLHHNGEYYITLVYNLMIQDALKVGFFDTDHVAILGTPEEVRNFEAWSTILKGHQVKNEADLLRCYRYWKGYHQTPS